MYPTVKRALDILLALVIGILFLPFGGLIALWIKLDSKGPVLFRQERPGMHCKLFTIYKFRTMRVEIEQDGAPLADMDRMTRAGRILRRLSLDEFPQMINILKGDMSFIGPRPLLVEYLPRYSISQMRRHEVRPGITGWAQVNGRNAISWEEKFELDVWYVEHISFGLDCKILLRTIGAVFSRKGINNSKEVPMPKFMGQEGAHE